MELPAPSSPSQTPRVISLREALPVWLRVALLSFGGPTAQIAVMHRIFVDEKRWISEHRFLHALNYCMLLPGPEAQQLATYIGWLLHGWRGGIIAGGLFVLPGAIALLALSILYVTAGELTIVAGVFFGLKPAVIAVVAEAVLRISRRVLKNPAMVAIAMAAFVAIFLFEVSFPWIIASAAAIGLVGGRLRPDLFHVVMRHGNASTASEPVDEVTLKHVQPTWRRAVLVAVLWLVIWLGPVAALYAAFGRGHVLVEEGLFFSRAATVTFGGAYAVLPYVAQQAVDRYGWLEPDEMLVGLGFAETTPGPLIMVVQFVGFLGAYRQMPEVSPLVAGILGSLVTTWTTFAPSFLWIFVGAPYIERLRGNQSLHAALSAITAAVVGVIVNLAIWFAMHVWFGEVTTTWTGPLKWSLPQWSTVNVPAVAITLIAATSLFVLRRGLATTLAIAVGCGIMATLLGVTQ